MDLLKQVKIDPVGVWHVTTEGDVEGKTTRDLGVYEGHIVEVAKALSSHASYALTFEPAQQLPEDEPRSSVEVRVTGLTKGERGMWDLSDNHRLISEWVGEHDALKKVVEGNSYRAVKFVFQPTEEDKQREADREEYERLKKKYNW